MEARPSRTAGRHGGADGHLRRTIRVDYVASVGLSTARSYKPNGQTIADKMLFMAAEMERDLERTMDGLATANAQGRYGGRPAKVDHDTLAIARACQARGESVTSIARHLKIGRSTLYRALATAETPTT